MRIWTLATIALFGLNCQAQKENLLTLGGRCEGCEALYEFGENKLNSIDTITGFEQSDEQLVLSGTVFQADGVTPAEEIIVYIYHTDQFGIYKPAEGARDWARRHGQYRGWIKTGQDGQYSFYTFRPASYPNTTIPQHIHITLKEPSTIPYYIDDIYFTDDPMLTDGMRRNQPNRGGSGIVTPEKRDGQFYIKRDIILRKNIPGS